MATAHSYISFVVRLWREQSAESPDTVTDWHGEVEHIQSGRQWSFHSLDELLSFLQAQTVDSEISGRSPDE